MDQTVKLLEDTMTKPVSWPPEVQAAIKRLGEKLFATTTEAGAVLGYDRRTVRAGITAGEIPAIKAGKTWRVPTAWLLKQAQLGTETETAGR
jgi:excisionase family DNA binding protein